MAYRADTSLVSVVQEKLARAEGARTLVGQVFNSALDLFPDSVHRTLTVQLHHLSSRIHDAALAHLCAELKATETVFPGTNLRLIYELVWSTQFPPHQEV